MARGRKHKRGDRGAKQHKGGENAQPLIDHWVNFICLILWLVHFLQILFYCDDRWRLLLQQFICYIFTLDRLCARLQCGLFRAAEPSKKWHSSASGDVGFNEHGSGSGALFFHGSGFWSFSHINILFTWCASSWIENELKQVHKTKRIHQTFSSNLIC